MKKTIAFITLFAFVVFLGGMVYAEMDTRTPEQKLTAARAYLKLLDQKIIRLRKAGKTALVKKMQAEKQSTLGRMKAWKAEMEGGPAPMAPTPPPPPRVAPRPGAAPAAAGLFGWGLNTGYTGGYVAGKRVVAARGDLIFADPMGIGPMLGLSSDAIAWKIGLGYAMGTDTGDKAQRKAIPLFIDGIINIPADLLGGIESYVGGGVNYSLYGTGRASGSYGIQAYYGIQGDIGLGGKSYAEVSYSVIRSGTGVATANQYSIKGIGINIGTQLVL